ncbi:MAG: hypothetical protein ABIW49_01165 [Knoellia sp.]
MTEPRRTWVRLIAVERIAVERRSAPAAGRAMAAALVLVLLTCVACRGGDGDPDESQAAADAPALQRVLAALPGVQDATVTAPFAERSGEIAFVVAAQSPTRTLRDLPAAVVAAVQGYDDDHGTTYRHYYGGATIRVGPLDTACPTSEFGFTFRDGRLSASQIAEASAAWATALNDKPPGRITVRAGQLGIDAELTHEGEVADALTWAVASPLAPFKLVITRPVSPGNPGMSFGADGPLMRQTVARWIAYEQLVIRPNTAFALDSFEVRESQRERWVGLALRFNAPGVPSQRMTGPAVWPLVDALRVNPSPVTDQTFRLSLTQVQRVEPNPPSYTVLVQTGEGLSDWELAYMESHSAFIDSPR